MKVFCNVAETKSKKLLNYTITSFLYIKFFMKMLTLNFMVNFMENRS